MAITADITWQFCQGDTDITSYPFPEQDATEVRVWDGDSLVVAFERNTNDKWNIVTSDGNVQTEWYDLDFSTPVEGLLFLGRQWGITFIGQ